MFFVYRVPVVYTAIVLFRQFAYSLHWSVFYFLLIPYCNNRDLEFYPFLHFFLRKSWAPSSCMLKPIYFNLLLTTPRNPKPLINLKWSDNGALLMFYLLTYLLTYLLIIFVIKFGCHFGVYCLDQTSLQRLSRLFGLDNDRCRVFGVY